MLLPAGELRDLALSLDIRCSCGRTTTPPFRAMLVDRPKLASVALGQIVIRIRCQACGQPPVRVALVMATEHAARAGDGRGPRPWEVVLVGD